MNSYLMILLCVQFLISCQNPIENNKKLEDKYITKLIEEIKNVGNQGQINIDGIFEFKWDTVVIPKSYVNLSSFDKVYSGLTEEMKMIQFDDSQSLIMFCIDKRIEKYIFIPKSKADFSPKLNDKIGYFDRSNSKFKVDIKVNDSGSRWTQLEHIE